MKKLRFFDSLKLVLATVACIFAFTPAHAATLPAGYTELEYIHFVNGVGNIKTGIIPTSSIEIELKASFESGYNSALAYNTGLSTSSIKGVYWQGSTGFGMNGRGASYAVANGSIPTVIQNKNNVIVNGRQYNYNGAVGDFVGINELFIGGINSNKFSGNIYSFIVRFNGVMERNFVPARRDIDGVLGMYDTVYMAFYTNQGSGSFTAGPDVIPQIKIATTRYNEEQFEPVQNRLSDAMDAVDDVVTRTMTQAQAIDQIANEKQTRPDEGCTAKYCLLVEDEDGTPHWYPIAGANGVAHALPAGYTELQYTYMTGGSYLLTDIVPHYDEKVEMDFATTSLNSQGYVFLGGRSAPDAGSGIQFYCNSTNTFIADGFGTRYTSSVTAVANTRYKYTYNNQIATLESGGSTLFTKTYTTSGANTAALALNAMNNNGSIQGNTVGIYLYSFKVWNAQGELVANYIPAKQTNPLTVGFYDTVSETFKTATAGTFTAGPDM